MVIWYQAESNRANPAPYACRFPAMIQDWRAKFGLALPFFFVQVAAYAAGGANWPVLQVAQTAALGLPQVGFATAMDLGDPTSPAGAIHPRDKQSVGARLVRSILALVYGQQLVHTGPQVASFSVDAAAPNAVTIALVPGASSQGLELRSTEGCDYATGGCCQQNPFMLGQLGSTWRRAGAETCPAAARPTSAASPRRWPPLTLLLVCVCARVCLLGLSLCAQAPTPARGFAPAA